MTQTDPQLAGEPGIWRVMARDILSLPEGLMYLSTFLAILRSPTERTLALTDRPDYTSHASFLAIGTALMLAVLGLSNTLWVNSAPTWLMTAQAAAVYPHVRDWMTAIQITLGYVISIPVGYSLFSRFVGTRLPVQRFIKCACLANGFYAPLLALGIIPFAYFNRPYSEAMTGAQMAGALAGPVIYLAVLAWSLTYAVRVTKRLWSISAIKAIGLMIVSQAIAISLTLLVMAGLTLLLDVVAPVFA